MQGSVAGMEKLRKEEWVRSAKVMNLQKDLLSCKTKEIGAHEKSVENKSNTYNDLVTMNVEKKSKSVEQL